MSRSDLHASLKAILSPAESKQYVVIVGANGTGTSTAVRKELGAVDGPKGVNFDCPPYQKLFSIELFELIGHEHEHEVDIRGGMRRWFEGKKVTSEIF